MFNSSIIKWGVLGTARIFRKRMLKAFQHSSGHIIVAVASRDINKAEQLAKDHNIPKYYGSYDSILKDDEIQAVYIPLPNSLHYQWVIKAAEKGKHILCEKPLAYSMDEAKKMIQLCKDKNLVLLEAHSYFLHPQYEELFQILKNDLIGKIRQVQIYFSFPAQKEHAIRFAHELGGGSFLDIGCYGIDLMHQIFDQDIQDEDIIFKMKNNVDMEFLGVFKFIRDIEVVIRTSFFQERQQTLMLQGEKGTIFLPNAFIPSGDKALLFIKINKDSWIKEIENVDQYSLLIREFGKQISGKQNLNIQYERYVKNTKILEMLLKLREKG